MKTFKFAIDDYHLIKMIEESMIKQILEILKLNQYSRIIPLLLEDKPKDLKLMDFIYIRLQQNYHKFSRFEIIIEMDELIKIKNLLSENIKMILGNYHSDPILIIYEIET